MPRHTLSAHATSVPSGSADSSVFDFEPDTMDDAVIMHTPKRRRIEEDRCERRRLLVSATMVRTA